MRDRANTVLTLVTAPTVPVVTLADVKAHLRVDTTASDDHIQLLIDAATARFDGRDGVIGRALRPQTWQVSAEAFPDVLGCISPYSSDVVYQPDGWRLPLPPHISVSSVTYIDGDNVEQTWDSSNYIVTNTDGPRGAMVLPAYGVSWPSVIAGRPDAARITFQAGYQTLESPADDPVPASLRAAVMLLVSAMFDDPARVDVPEIVNSLTAPYRVRHLG